MIQISLNTVRTRKFWNENTTLKHYISLFTVSRENFGITLATVNI